MNRKEHSACRNLTSVIMMPVTTLKILTRLAAKIADMDVSLVNLIDTFTHMPGEDSVCQYNITEDNYFEVADLAAGNKFI